MYEITELLTAVHSEMVGNLGISFSQCAGYEEQLPHPSVVCKQGETLGKSQAGGALQRDCFLNHSEGNFLKIKEENILKKLAAGGTVSSKLTSSINHQCRRTVKFWQPER